MIFRLGFQTFHDLFHALKALPTIDAVSPLFSTPLCLQFWVIMFGQTIQVPYPLLVVISDF